MQAHALGNSRLRQAVLAAAASTALAVPSACSSATPTPSATTSEKTARASSSSGLRTTATTLGEARDPVSRRRAKTAKVEARTYSSYCTRLRSQVHVTYELRREPGPTGQRLWVELRLVNRSGLDLSGSSGGQVRVTHPVLSPRQPAHIDWGGSAFDTIGVGPRSTSVRPIYHVLNTKLDVHDDSRVELFGVYTGLADVHPRGEMRTCSFPADMRAPAGLVVYHPCGRWFLPVGLGEKLTEAGRLRDQPSSPR